ncbi:hypothetical protein [Adlercreutzia sp. ZJ304]|uniref:hypothetical protein n=1 Tax=Adlercreutzia sp. ZJ304 TaxID=2709791 RepID=UPI0013EE157B|nr:hypothetical protein [Adlercreutzia sp. ZJ304]
MKKALKLLAVLVIAVVLVLGGGILLEKAGIETPISGVANKAANTALDASGIKSKADSALRSNASKIAEKTGLPVSSVNSMIDNLNIESWQVTNLPADATATGTTSMTYDGVSATVTTYDDPSVVTVDTGAGEVTLEVPASAQDYIGYLGYL